MSLIKLQFKPGIVRDVSRYTNSGGWYECNLMRFRFGVPQTMGGWTKYSNYIFAGTARLLHNWLDLGGSNYLFVGTNEKVYIEEGGAYADITPLRDTVVLNGPFAISNGSSTLTVTDNGHGASEGDYVTFSGSASLGGTVTAAVLNANHKIASIVNSNSYTITLSVTANSSDTGNGGATVTTKYEIATGSNTQIGGGGWSASTWGRSGWGTGVDVTTQIEIRLWHADNFGEDLIFNIRNGGIYYWDASGGTTTRAVTLRSLSDTSCPTVAAQVIVSDKDRHVIAFGCDNGNGVQDPLLIRFSTQENPFIWENLPTNTAGELPLGTGSKIMRALETKREIVVFTDATMYSMQFLGPPYTFGIQQIAGLTTIASCNAAIAVEDNIFWMTNHNFSVYDGTVRDLDCPLRNYIFSDFNHTQQDKIFAAHVPNHAEIMWFYCSSDADEPDRYVTYNYREQVWYYGTLSRTAWLAPVLREYPVATATDGYLYNHEIGNDADGEAMNSYVESAPIELNLESGPGERHMLITRIIPDVCFTGSNATNPSMIFTLKTSAYPGSTYNYTDDLTTTRTATVPCGQFTEYGDVRLRGRQVVIRAEKNAEGVFFSFGAPRLEVRADGRR